ncbi:MAG: TIGR01777 family oxidoreductase [Prolixibacteraceae bacterium]|nr:TIGR01777 family oxidoreductase [Prolixibacteraceae bacterium]
MKVAITGASGLIGKAITAHFVRSGHECFALKRDESTETWKEKIISANAIINLAGAPIFVRWTKKNRKKILESRTRTTHKIVSILNSLPYEIPKKTFISASATGIYPDDKFKIYDEFTTEKGNGFLAEVVSKWEAEADDLVNPSVRLAIVRLGMVLDKNGGALNTLMKVFKFGLGGRIGNGKQIMTWIHIKDVVQAIQFIIDNEKASGIFNFTTPNPLTNKEFTHILGNTIKRPAFLTIPPFALRLLYGKAACIMINGATYYPSQLTKLGFVFQFPSIESALNEILNKGNK